MTLEKPKETTPRQAKGGGAKFVYQELRNEILSLKLAPGEPLDETTLAQRFAMSRSPIREALVRLSGEGLVEMLPNRSTLVAPVDLAKFPRYVEALDFLQRINTRLAAKSRTEADLAKMTSQASAFETACQAGNFLQMSAANRDFHMAVAAAGKNTYLARAYGQLLDEGRRILHMHFEFIQSSPNDHMLTSEHFAIADAIQMQDVELADRLAHAHTRQFHDRFMNFMRANYIDDFDFEGFSPIGVRSLT